MGDHPRRGIFTLANDAVYEWSLAFLRSVARNSGGLPVTIIPFDDNCSRLERLAREHGAEIWDPELLDDLDELGARCYPTSPKNQHLFRKFAAFHGAYEEFVFFDSDIVVRTDFEPLLEYLTSQTDLIVDCHFSPDAVYRPGPFRQRRIAEGARCFNSGFFMSTAGLAPLDELHASMGKLLPNLGDLAPGVGDQPFVNFWAEEAGLSVVAIDELAPELSRETWAGLQKKYIGTSPFIHWAGFRMTPSMPRVDLFLEYRCRNALSRLAWKVKRHVVKWSDRTRRRSRRAASWFLKPLRDARTSG